LPLGCEGYGERKAIQVNLQEKRVIDVVNQSESMFPSFTGVLDTEAEAGDVKFLANIHSARWTPITQSAFSKIREPGVHRCVGMWIPRERGE
jgi:hypothetical protein